MMSRAVVMLAGVLTAGACLPAGAAVGPPRPPRWLGDLEAARKVARAEGKPIFVVFRCQH